MKKKQVVSLLLFVVVLLCLLLSSCGEREKYSAYSLDYFDTATSIVGYADSREDFDKVSSEILAELEEYHRLFTIYHRYDGLENLCTINELQNGAHRTVSVDERIVDMLMYSKEMYERTDGKVNIAMGSVLSIWHDYRKAGLHEPWAAELPPFEKLTEAAQHINIDDLIVDEENSTVFIRDPKMTLDVGAIAKGYAVEMVARGLEENGISGYVINVGGNVRTVGTKGDGEKWLAGIENSDGSSDEPYIAYLALAGDALVTSGSYQRFYTVNGKSYHHIIDSQTLMPAEGYRSVSVVCKNSADGDTLSTALFCMSVEDGKALIETFDGVEVLWVLSDGTEVYSEGFSDYLTDAPN